MKKFLVIMAMILPLFTFVGCSDDDDDVKLETSALIGKWNVSSYSTGGEFQDIPKGVIYVIINNDATYEVQFLKNHYTGTYKIEGNTIVGTTKDPIIERFTFNELKDKNAVISYSNDDGDSYKFKAYKE